MVPSAQNTFAAKQKLGKKNFIKLCLQQVWKACHRFSTGLATGLKDTIKVRKHLNEKAPEIYTLFFLKTIL